MPTAISESECRPAESWCLAKSGPRETGAVGVWAVTTNSESDVIEGTGGARKVRFTGKGKGKRGGYRVITFFSGTEVPVFLLNIFAKNEKTDLTSKERRVLKTVLGDVVMAYRNARESR